MILTTVTHIQSLILVYLYTWDNTQVVFWPFLRNNLSLRIPTVSEFVGTHTTVQKVLRAQNLLIELGYPSAVDTILFQDNKSTIRLISHKGNSGRTKHMIREAVKNNNISIEYLPSEEMTADTLTKPLGSVLFPLRIHQCRLLNTTPP